MYMCVYIYIYICTCSLGLLTSCFPEAPLGTGNYPLAPRGAYLCMRPRGPAETVFC